eukprot:9762237-Alexandrium_andersonii.AAC.1
MGNAIGSRPDREIQPSGVPAPCMCDPSSSPAAAWSNPWTGSQELTHSLPPAQVSLEPLVSIAGE